VPGVPVIFGGELVGGAGGSAVTAIVNAGSETLFIPSLTLMMMFEYVPTFELDGVPLSKPVAALKDAQAG
jgi:hypothetical protein